MLLGFKDFIGFNRDTLELTSVTSAGQQLQVPKLFLAMYKNEELFIGKDRKTNKVKWIGTRVDLIFGSN